MILSSIPFMMGVSFFIFIPILSLLKIFDILAFLFFITRIHQGFRFKKIDYLFFVFIWFAFLSAFFASRETTVDSLLQTARYIFYFLLARQFHKRDDINSFLNGLKIGIYLIILYIAADMVYYYLFGCTSIGSVLFDELEDYSFTHRNALLPSINGCLYFRPSGLSWDPGGFYPILLLVVAALYSKSIVGKFSVLFSFVAISRTALLAYIASKALSANKIIGSLILVVMVIFISGLIFFNQELVPQDGDLRHAAYPFLSSFTLLLDPVVWLAGKGLRGGAEYILDNFNYPFLDVLNHDHSTLIIESTFFNILLGSGVVGAMSYFSWLYICFGRLKSAYILFLCASLFYTFDTSQLLFFIPFLYQYNFLSQNYGAKVVQLTSASRATLSRLGPNNRT